MHFSARFLFLSPGPLSLQKLFSMVVLVHSFSQSASQPGSSLARTYSLRFSDMVAVDAKVAPDEAELLSGDFDGFERNSLTKNQSLHSG